MEIVDALRSALQQAEFAKEQGAEEQDREYEE
jgi:hypothetical protein